MAKSKRPNSHPTSFRFTDKTWQMLGELAEAYGTTRGIIVTMAISALHKTRPRPPRNPKKIPDRGVDSVAT